MHCCRFYLAFPVTQFKKMEVKACLPALNVSRPEKMVMNTVDFHLNPQAALGAPRWQWTEGKTVEVEHKFSEHIAEALERRGHHIVRTTGGTEPRTDGIVAAW